MRDITGEYTDWQGKKQPRAIEDLIKCSDGIYRPRTSIHKELSFEYDKTGKPVVQKKIGELLDKNL